MNSGNKGKLYLVATPIGNLEDITLRALNTLKQVDIIAAEDTRQTLKLLNHFGIAKPLTSYHEHNKRKKGSYLLEMLLEGKNIALVSDAGTPGISDPGEEIVREVVLHGIEVIAIPGPSAVIAALVVSGLTSGRFVFEGFLPVNKRSRRERIESLRNETRTIVLYEAPHKLIYTLKDLKEILGERRIVLARELTKKFEEVIRCTLGEAIDKYSEKGPKGEYVLIVEGADEKAILKASHEEWNRVPINEHLEMHIEKGMSKKEAIKKIAQERGLSKGEVYRALLEKDGK